MKIDNEEHKYFVQWSKKFKKEYKLAIKRNYKIEELDEIIRILANGEVLPEKYRDHELEGNYKKHRECHIRPDWILIYKIEQNTLVLELTRTGTHADLFGK